MYCDFQDGLEGLGDPGGHIAPRVVMLFSTRNGLPWVLRNSSGLGPCLSQKIRVQDLVLGLLSSVTLGTLLSLTKLQPPSL